MLEDSGYTFSSTSDTEVILKFIARTYKKGLEKSLFNTLQLIKGSYALCIITENSLIGVRDPNGIRPLCLGKVGDGYILASESCAIDAVNGEFLRDVEPGETVFITKEGIRSFKNVEILRRAGAKEVHFRVSSPPVKFPCHLGIDTPSKGELISSEHDVSQICKEIGADSLAFISLEGMLTALKESNVHSFGFCQGCFTGEYPVG